MATLSTINCIKVFVKFCFIIGIIYGVSITYFYHSERIEKSVSKDPLPIRKRMKYILQWTAENVAPFNFTEKGNSVFIKNKCKHTNCFITGNASYLRLTDFDAIIFIGTEISNMKPSQLPRSRLSKQKYIFTAVESSDRFPVCNESFDNFFNWTWTYKLSSNFRFGYIAIYDLDSNMVGPAIAMKWPETMIPIGEEVKVKLSGKSKAAAWFVSNCETINKREDFVARLNEELKSFGLNVDTYGSCSKLKCPKNKRRECYKKLEKEYFFYLSFENSFDEDYVTEKLLTALYNYAVPVVYGTANYSRFLPPGSYLNAKKLGPKNLARIINELIIDKDKYYDYFRWRNHFTYNYTLSTADICKLCEALNDDQKMNTVTVWKKFRKWWNSPRHAARCS